MLPAACFYRNKGFYGTRGRFARQSRGFGVLALYNWARYRYK